MVFSHGFWPVCFVFAQFLSRQSCCWDIMGVRLVPFSHGEAGTVSGWLQAPVCRALPILAGHHSESISYRVCSWAAMRWGLYCGYKILWRFNPPRLSWVFYSGVKVPRLHCKPKLCEDVLLFLPGGKRIKAGVILRGMNGVFNTDFFPLATLSSYPIGQLCFPWLSSLH